MTHHVAPSRPTFAATVRGTGSAPGLLLAHGAGGSVESNFGPILDQLAAGRTVIGVDYPGTGRTPRSAQPLDLDDLADELVAAADAEGVEQFAIAGYSLGGPVAIRAASRHPERVDALVLTATFARPDQRLRLAASIWQDLYERGDTRLLAEFLTLVAFSTEALDGFGPQRMPFVIDLLSGQIPPGTPEHTELIGRIDVRDELATIAVPTLVITTTRDPLVSPALQHELAASIPNARTTAIDTGHLPFAEQPARWAELLTTFLDAVAQHTAGAR